MKAFQTAKGLTADGVIGPMTWQALLAYAPAQVTWSASGASLDHGRGEPLGVPAAGRMVAPYRARRGCTRARYEIPPHLGRG